MSQVGQINLTKKKPPRAGNGDQRIWNDVYDQLNTLVDAVNQGSTTEHRRGAGGKTGDIRVFKDKSEHAAGSPVENKYFMEVKVEDGWAIRELAVTDKGSRTGTGYYSVSNAVEGSGTGGKSGFDNLEYKFIPAINSASGKLDLTIGTHDGTAISNSSIVEGDLVGDSKVWDAAQKPNKTTLASGYLYNDGSSTGTVVSNADIVEGDLVGSGKTFSANPQTLANTAEANAQTGITNAATADGKAVAAQNTANSALSTANGKNISFYQNEAPTALATGDMWFDTNDEYKMYRWGGSAWNLVNAVPTLSAIVINASQINAGTISSGRIATSSLTAANINASQINAGTISADRIATSSLTAATITADAINMDTATISGTLEAGNINVSGVVTTESVNATTITADAINMDTATVSGTLAAGNIDVSGVVSTESVNAVGISASSISTGTLSAAEINMSSGSAQIETSGKITTKNLVKCFSTDVGGSRMGLRLIEHGDTSSADSGSTNWWQLFVDSDDLIFNKGGYNKVTFDDDGKIEANAGANEFTPNHTRMRLESSDTGSDRWYEIYNTDTEVSTGHNIGGLRWYSNDSSNSSEHQGWVCSIGGVNYYDGRMGLTFRHGGVGSADDFYTKFVYDGDVINGTNTTVWQQTSDERVKENIVEVDDALSVVTALRPVTFNFNSDYCEESGHKDNKRWGFLGQEFKTAIPEGVTTSADYGYEDFHKLNSDMLVPLLVKAVKELKAEVDALKA
jgi:hypothetical protein